MSPIMFKVIVVCIWCLCGLGLHLCMAFKTWEKGHSINLLWFVVDCIGFAIFGPIAIIMMVLIGIEITGKTLIDKQRRAK